MSKDSRKFLVLKKKHSEIFVFFSDSSVVVFTIKTPIPDCLAEMFINTFFLPKTGKKI